MPRKIGRDKDCANLIFTRRSQFPGNSTRCYANNCETRIKNGEAHWIGGHHGGTKPAYCPKHFAFYVSRYSHIVLVGEMSAVDLWWKDWWDNQLELQLMNLILSIAK